MFDVSGQGPVFLIMVFAGSIIGLAYSILYIFRYCFKFHQISEIIFDVAFCAAAFFVAVFFVRTFADGELRLYVFGGILLGFALFRLTFFKLISKCTDWVYKQLAKLYRLLKKLPLLKRLLK